MRPSRQRKFPQSAALSSVAGAADIGLLNASYDPDARADAVRLRFVLIGATVSFLTLFIVLPLITVLTEALSKGIAAYLAALGDPDTPAAIRLTLLTAAISVVANVIFGLIGAWAVSKFDFRRKNLQITLIELPFSVSPVIAGLVFVLLFDLQG